MSIQHPALRPEFRSQEELLEEIVKLRRVVTRFEGTVRVIRIARRMMEVAVPEVSPLVVLDEVLKELDAAIEENAERGLGAPGGRGEG